MSAMAGSAGQGTWSVVEKDREETREESEAVGVGVVKNRRGSPKSQGAAESVANAGVSPRRGRADRMARIHGLCIQNVGGNLARGDSPALHVVHWQPAKPLQRAPRGRVRAARLRRPGCEAEKRGTIP